MEITKSDSVPSKTKRTKKSYTYSVKYIVSMIIEDPPKNVKVKKTHPTSSRSRAPGRPSQLARLAPETHSRCPPSPCPLSPRPSPPRSPVVPSAPSARPRPPPPRDPSWYVFRFVFVARSSRSRARAHPEEIASSIRAGVRDRYIWETGWVDGRRAVCVPTATDDARDDSNEYIFIRLPARVVARVVARVASPGRRGV